MPALRTIAILVFFLWLFLDALAVFRHKTGAAENRDRSSLMVLMIGNMLTWPLGIALSYGSMGAMHSSRMQIAGLIVMAVGIVLRSTAIAQLGRFHTPNVAIRSDHQLVENGLYRFVRHPSYLGALVAFFGLGLALGNWLSVTVIMGITPWIYLYRIHEEDSAMLVAFGDTYRAYCARTKRLIPWVY
jgi:protein-S-isoprenylcysteine O-methyltransferase